MGNFTIGYWTTEQRIKADAAPIDNETKFAWDDDDYEEVPVFHEYTPDEFHKIAQSERDETMALVRDDFLASITVNEKPAEKIGFITTHRYDKASHAIVWEFEPDPNYTADEDGSYLKPYTFSAPMEVELGLWYTDGEDIWECVEAGTAEAFTAPWFDVIAA